MLDPVEEPRSREWRQTSMRGGLAWLDQECRDRFGKDFLSAAETERTQVLDDIAYRTKEGAPKVQRPELRAGQSFFEWFRDLTSSGFWSSKIGHRGPRLRRQPPVRVGGPARRGAEEARPRRRQRVSAGIARRELLRRLSLAGFGAATSPAWARAFASLASAEHVHADAPVSTASDWKPSVPLRRPGPAGHRHRRGDHPRDRHARRDRGVREPLRGRDPAGRRQARARRLPARPQVDRPTAAGALFGSRLPRSATPQEQNALLTIISSRDNDSRRTRSAATSSTT